MKNRYRLFYLLLIGLLSSLSIPKTIAQEFPDSLKNLVSNPVSIGLDIFLVDIGFNATARINKGFSLGLEFELGFNISDFPLIQNQPSPDFYYEIPVQGAAVFLRIDNIKFLKLDVGYRSETWSSFFPSAVMGKRTKFNGIYTKIFFKSKLRNKSDFRYQPSFGIRLSAGTLKVPEKPKETNYNVSLWIRIPLSDTQIPRK